MTDLKTIEIRTGIVVKIDGIIEEEVSIRGREVSMGRGALGDIRVEAWPTEAARSTNAYKVLRRKLGCESFHDMTDTWRGKLSMEEVEKIDSIIRSVTSSNRVAGRSMMEIALEAQAYSTGDREEQKTKEATMATKTKKEEVKKVAGTAGLKPAEKKAAGPGANETKSKLHELNKKLAAVGTSQKPDDKKKANQIRKEIRDAVAGTNGAFTTDDFGYAVQVKKSVDRPKKTQEKKEKVVRKCPCCGEDTYSYFKMGHDGRVKGMFKRILEGKEKEADLATPELKAMYKEYKKNPEARIVDVAKAVLN